jgi:hypothetical protein
MARGISNEKRLPITCQGSVDVVRWSFKAEYMIRVMSCYGSRSLESCYRPGQVDHRSSCGSIVQGIKEEVLVQFIFVH